MRIMNRISDLFHQKRNILSIYFTAGYPHLNDTTIIIEELQKSGVDIIEIGIPFSDPLADGATIQRSSSMALKNGMSLKLLFTQLQNIREAVHVPLILMGYLNPLLQFGIENFCRKAAAAGIDGVIIPDLPLDEYIERYKTIFEKYGLANILLVTPQTSENRIRLIDRHSSGFIYLVSSASITGAKEIVNAEQKKYFERIQNMNLKNPVLTGFGISNAASFKEVCKYSHGAIIGSAFITALQKTGNMIKDISEFINSIRSVSNADIKVNYE